MLLRRRREGGDITAGSRTLIPPAAQRRVLPINLPAAPLGGLGGSAWRGCLKAAPSYPTLSSLLRQTHRVPSCCQCCRQHEPHLLLSTCTGNRKSIKLPYSRPKRCWLILRLYFVLSGRRFQNAALNAHFYFCTCLEPNNTYMPRTVTAHWSYQG